MEGKSKLQQRKQKMQGIRLGLQVMPIMRQVSMQVEQRLVKNRSRKPSTAMTDKELTLSKVWSESDSDSEDKYRSLFYDKYEVGDKIGEGAHGVVKKCYCKQTHKLYAVKTFRLDCEHILFLKKNFIDIKQLKHPHILGYKALFFEMKTETCHLVMDYLPFPDLLHADIKTEQQLKEIIFQVLQALKYIHKHKICHRDIKPQNILYDKEKNNVILIDFGISKKLVDRGRKKDMLTLTGTPYYRAPQMFEGGGYDEMVDLWALGITMYKLMTGATPFESEYHSETITNIMKGEFTFSAQTETKYSKSARNLVIRLLKKRSQRLTAEEAMKDMWFIELYKHQDDFMRSLTFDGTHQNALGHSLTYNNSLLAHLKGKQNPPKNKEEIDEFRSLKLNWVKEQESMIYGCEELNKHSSSSRTASSHHL